MTITYHRDILQGTDEWLALRRGVITASEMCLLITQTGKTADNDKSRAHVWELLAQRISGRTEPQYISDDMLRGEDEETAARDLYSEHYAPVDQCGFITREIGGAIVGYSPDGLVGNDGLIEIKSRRQRFQIESIASGVVPAEYLWQIQTGLFVTGRAWCDFISYSNGLPMLTIRVEPDAPAQERIAEVVAETEQRIAALRAIYDGAAHSRRLIKTEWRERMEILA